MVTFSEDMAATALELLTEFGEAGALRRLTPGGGPAHNPGASSSTDYACQLYPDAYRTSERDGTRIQNGDKKVLLATDGIPSIPTPADQLVIRGEVHKIIAVDEVSAQGQAIMWTVQARR